MSHPSGFPRIGIPCQYNDETNTMHHVPLISQNLTYVRSITEAGGLPVLISPTLPEAMLRSIYEELDGLLLAGGVDVDPALYGESRSPKLGRLDPERDRAELKLAGWAFEDRLPCFGICRGIQILNVALGGTLFQDIATQVDTTISHTRTDQPRDWIAHPIKIVEGSRLADIMGRTELTGVNSLHHQAIKVLADPFEAVAESPDGIVEGMERQDGAFCIAVQWHPEELLARASQRSLFRAFVEAARA